MVGLEFPWLGRSSTNRPFASPSSETFQFDHNGFTTFAPGITSRIPNEDRPASVDPGPSPKNDTVFSEIACAYTLMTVCSGSSVRFDLIFGLPNCTVIFPGGVCTNLKYTPARQDPFGVASASAFQLGRQVSLGCRNPT